MWQRLLNQVRNEIATDPELERRFLAEVKTWADAFDGFEEFEGVRPCGCPRCTRLARQGDTADLDLTDFAGFDLPY